MSNIFDIMKNIVTFRYKFKNCNVAIQKFGFEIRKLGDIKNLYKDVDFVLSKYEIPDKGVSINMKANAVAHSLNKMLKADKYFDVCTIRDCASLCNIYLPYEREKLYKTQHCIYWNEMDENFRQVLISMVLDDFRDVLNP